MGSDHRSPADILMEVRDLLVFGGFCQQSLAKDDQDRNRNPRAPEAVSWCVEGAFAKVMGLPTDATCFLRHLTPKDAKVAWSFVEGAAQLFMQHPYLDPAGHRRVINAGTPMEINDELGFGYTIEMLDTAIRMAKEAHPSGTDG